MEFIRGGDSPKTVLEQRVYNFKHIVDWGKANLPKYNPYQFRLCRELNGDTRAQFAKKAILSTARYVDIEKGNVTPTEEEVDNIFTAQHHVLRPFFEKWPETRPDFSKVVAVPIAIDYYEYKIFRDINPRMKII